jgi:hypothetical protein
VGYQDSLDALRTTTDRQVSAAWRALKSGALTEPQFVELSTAYIVRANNAAAAIADLSLSVELLRITGETYAPLGVMPRSYDAKVTARGMKSLLKESSTGVDIDERLSRFAKSAPLDAATNAYGQAIAQSTAVEGYVRQMDGDPCQLCRWWYRDGRVWQKDHPMPRHKGCECVQRIIVTEKAKSATRSTE